jgi:starch phosphorylase
MIANGREDSLPADRHHVAYFTMEIGISHSIPTYSGGLGILAGDLLKSFADMKIPVVGVTLLNEKGYFYQSLDEGGHQSEQPVQWNVSDFMVLMPNEVSVTIEGRQVRVRAWKHTIRGFGGNGIPVFFLDANIEGNSPYDRTLTSFLYGGDRAYRLAQEIVLGIGGIRMLESLGYGSIKKYHMNEGHAALLTIELLRRTYRDADCEEHCYDFDAVRKKCVFTSHTPVAAGHDKFDLALFRRLLGDYAPQCAVMHAVQDGLVNMTLLGLNMSMYVNGVAKRHGEIERRMFPEFRIDSITNGIHPPSWASPPFKALFDAEIPGWASDPFTLRYALSITKDKIWGAHLEAKRLLLAEANAKTSADFRIKRFTVGCARRFTAYKRPDLLLYDLERLRRISQSVGDVQVIFAGKAHPQDLAGKELIEKVYNTAHYANSQGWPLKVEFLPQYDMQLAKLMVAGCDLWLNTPQRPFEASGTSGMKAALNGVPHLSTLDGWWLEGHIEGVTGWSIGAHPHDPDFEEDTDSGKDAADLYAKLEQIIPVFYGNRDKWVELMRHCIAINGSFFNTCRMAQQYVANAYLD